MSWNVEAIGRAPAVAKKLAADFTAYKCAEPEESIRMKAAEAIAAALAAFPENYAVKVKAFGSQTEMPGGGFSNSLTVTIEPIYAFLE